MIDYSVIIRTTGNAGEKYTLLLKSINHLIPQPKEVIVVLPVGYKKPKETLGYETFYFCEKGMVKQRLFGLDMCKTKYALFCDDDVEFEEDFVKKLHEPLKNDLCEFSAAPLLSFLPRKGLESFFHAVTGAAVPTFFHKDKYVNVLRTTGYSYNRNINTDKCIYYPADSLPWTCFYANAEAMRKIKFEEETWLDKNGYAAMDDLTMFYKAKLLGYKTLVISDAYYIHNDARTSRKSDDVKLNVAYSLEYNRIIFWYKFIYLKDNIFFKIIDILSIGYYYFMKLLFLTFKYIIKRLNKEIYFTKLKAIKAAIKDISDFD